MAPKNGRSKQGKERTNPLIYIEQRGLSSWFDSLKITLWCSGTEF